jgi:hypothetical protein
MSPCACHPLQQLLAEHGKMREAAEKREAERREKEAARRAELLAAREADAKKPGIQRLRAQQYDELRKAALKGGKLGVGQVGAEGGGGGGGGMRVGVGRR